MRLRSFDQEVRNFLVSPGIGIPFPGNVYPVLKAGTASAEFWTRKFESGAQSHTVAVANGKLTSLQNDVVIVTPESHSLAESLTISASGTHWVGASTPAYMNQRTRIGMSTTFTPMISITGSGNSFHNLYLMHGTAVGDYVGTAITGSRNSFYNMHFAGPANEAQASDANFRGVTVTGCSETYFKDCVFGNHSSTCDEATALLKIGAGNGITILENCTFLMRVTAGQTDPFFVEIDNASDTGMTLFRNCLFIADPTFGTPAVAFTFLGSSLGYVYLDALCQFVNVTNITSTASDIYMRIATLFSSTDDDVGYIALTPTLA